MPGKSKTEDKITDFEKAMEELDDEQLAGVLKKRNHYQPEAVRVAIRKALERGIIRSEEDLRGQEFSIKPLRRKLFPEIESGANRDKIRKSISRGLLIAGAFPTAWSFLRMNAGFTSEGILLLAFGVCWMGLAFSLMRKFSLLAARLLSVLAILSLGYAVKYFLALPQFIFMDVFIATALYLLLAYGLVFIFRLKE
ncbi:hypothetical protein D1164_23075 [Mariniphaga sediminis]|uniref:Uncharacterized protein n=1 Tax=Mariniphaga sediminis TaxID=1628158 RepID=A0A399CS59_9BACT|nr:hypothetical protein [Mariniphaga sediminis]RIH62789.1 hypothetical protein D1164_23075 [Mariniphaga sediminis]